MSDNTNFIQNWPGFPDENYSWDTVYNNPERPDSPFAENEMGYFSADGDPCLKSNDTTTYTEGGVDRNITVSQALADGYINCNDICEEDRATFGFKKNCSGKVWDKKKTGSWITNFLAGTGLYRPVSVNPNAPTQSTNQLVGGGALYGCTNPSALNYNPMANTDDGSCQVKPGLSPLAWAGIGVGALLLIIGIVAISTSGGKSTRRGTTRRRRKSRSSYSRRPSQKIVVNLED